MTSYELIRQKRDVRDFDWILHTDGSCWDKKQCVYGGAAWMLNIERKISQTTVCGGTHGDTDRAELMAFTEGLRQIHNLREERDIRFDFRVLWITDRESLALQVAKDPGSEKPFNRRSINLDLWAAYEHYFQPKFDVTVAFSHRNTTYGMNVVDNLSRMFRESITKKFPGMAVEFGLEDSDYSGWSELMNRHFVDTIDAYSDATVLKRNKRVPFDIKADVAESPELSKVYDVLKTSGVELKFASNGVLLPEIE